MYVASIKIAALQEMSWRRKMLTKYPAVVGRRRRQGTICMLWSGSVKTDVRGSFRKLVERDGHLALR